MKSTIEPKDELPKNVRDVNELIKKAFGWRYKGNTHIGGGCIDGSRNMVGYLETISKLTFTAGDPAFGCGVVGSINQDGSKIRVRLGERWLKKAREYAELYREMFHTEVEITQAEKYFKVSNELRYRGS